MSYILAHSALLIYNVILQYLSLRIVLFLSCCVFLYFELCILCVALLCQGPRVNKVFLLTEDEEQVILLKQVLITPIHIGIDPAQNFLREFLNGNFGVGRLRSSKISSYSIFKALWASTISVEKHSSRTNCPPQNLLWERKQTSVQWASTISLEGAFIHLAANLLLGKKTEDLESSWCHRQRFMAKPWKNNSVDRNICIFIKYIPQKKQEKKQQQSWSVTAKKKDMRKKHDCSVEEGKQLLIGQI